MLQVNSGGFNMGGSPGDFSGLYNSLLNQSKQTYGSVMGKYNDLLFHQQQRADQIQQGYSQLGSQVQGTLAHVGDAQKQAIADAYAQQQGQSTEQLTNAGLGNTTVASSVGRGNLADEMKAQTGLASQMAQLQAGYQSQIGMAGLDFANQASAQKLGLGQAALGFEGSYMPQQQKMLADVYGQGQQLKQQQSQFQQNLALQYYQDPYNRMMRQNSSRYGTTISHPAYAGPSFM